MDSARVAAASTRCGMPRTVAGSDTVVCSATPRCFRKTWTADPTISTSTAATAAPMPTNSLRLLFGGVAYGFGPHPGCGAAVVPGGGAHPVRANGGGSTGAGWNGACGY